MLSAIASQQSPQPLLTRTFGACMICGQRRGRRHDENGACVARGRGTHLFFCLGRSYLCSRSYSKATALRTASPVRHLTSPPFIMDYIDYDNKDYANAGEPPGQGGGHQPLQLSHLPFLQPLGSVLEPELPFSFPTPGDYNPDLAFPSEVGLYAAQQLWHAEKMISQGYSADDLQSLMQGQIVHGPPTPVRTSFVGVASLHF